MAFSANYIKKYDENLYELLKKKFEEEELNLSLLSLKNNKLFKMLTSGDYSDIPEKYYLRIIHKAMKFMDIDKETFNHYAATRITHEEDINSEKQALPFWFSQNKHFLAFNIVLQLRDYRNIFHFVTEYIKGKEHISYCDYGCGSGSLSFALNERNQFEKMAFYDLDCYHSDFVKYYISSCKLNAQWFDILSEQETEQYDVVICLDVLEHIEKSYDVLVKLTKKVKKGGLLILKGAFEIDSYSHLPLASQNFYVDNDGPGFVSREFSEIKKFYYPALLSGAFIKK